MNRLLLVLILRKQRLLRYKGEAWLGWARRGVAWQGMARFIFKTMEDKNYWIIPGVKTEKLQKVICDFFEIEPSDLFSKKRDRQISDAKLVYRWALCQKRWTHDKIACHMGNCKRSNITLGLKTIANLEETNKDIRELMKFLREKLEVGLIKI